MSNYQKLYLIINDTHASWKKRTTVLLCALFVNYSGHYYINPYIRSLIEPFFESFDENKLSFIRHLLFYSFPKTLFCSAAIFILIKTSILKLPSFKRNVKKAFMWGTVVGVIVGVLTIAQVLVTGGSFDITVNIWSLSGNLFSNAYEEIIYRGLVFSASLYFFRKPWAAAIISGLVFGFSHSQYGIGQQLGVGVVGTVLSLIYYSTGNLLAPWVAHQVTDMIVEITLNM